MKTAFPPGFGSSRGLTLLEALVSLTLAAVLIVMTFSGIQRTRVQAADAACLANLRATGQAALLYFSERNGNFFPSKFWYSRLSRSERSGMRDYIGFISTAKITSPEFLVDSILTCPRLQSLCPAKFPVVLNRCFTMNRFLVAKDPAAADELLAGVNLGSPMRLANVPNAQRMWAFMDGTTSNAQDSSEFATIASPKSVPSSQVLYPHGGRQNIVFMDGHVESWTVGQISAPPHHGQFWGDTRISQ